MKEIRVLLVDDHEICRCGMRIMLEREEDIEIVGDCSSVEETLLQTEILSPNIILMEAKTPGIDGIETARCLKRNELDYDGDVIILAESVNYRDEALEAGAAGYLLKDITGAELAQAIREVYWSKQSPEDREGLVKEVELVIPSPVDAAQLLRFVCQVEEALEATIVQQVGSWDRDTAITIMPRRSTPLTVILDKLGKMPDVEDVKEKPAAKYESFSFAKKIIARPETHPRKEFLVTLKQASTAEQLAGIAS